MPSVAPSEIGMLFQDDALLPWKTARDNVALGLTFRGMQRRRARWCRPTTGSTGSASPASSDRYPRHLSGGQRKRVALAQVLAHEAEAAADGRAVRLARRHRARPRHPGRRRAGRARKASACCSSPTISKRRSASPTASICSRRARARASRSNTTVPIPRPRDPVKARVHPAFAPLYEKLWNDLSHEVDVRSRAEAAE